MVKKKSASLVEHHRKTSPVDVPLSFPTLLWRMLGFKLCTTAPQVPVEGHTEVPLKRCTLSEELP